MAGINKNFVVKNGLEVASNLIIADDTVKQVGIATTSLGYTLHVNGGIGVTDIYVTGIITSKNLSVQGAVSFNDFSANTANIGTLNASTLIYTPGIGSFSQLNIGTGGTSLKVTDAGFVGIGTTNPNSTLSIIGNVGVTGVVTTRNLNVSGVGTIVTLTSTTGTITTLTNTTLRSTTANATTGYIVTGVTTNFTSTNATATNLTGTAATITTLRSTTETTGTLNAVSGVVTSISGTNLVYSGVSTFTNGPVLIGSGTSTGTADQDLQVTGSAYISENLGLGLTNPTNKLNVSGDASVTGIFTATTFSGNVNAGVGTITNITNTNLTGTAATITTLNSTTGNITTLTSTTANATTGYIVTGVTTNFTSTNATATNLTGTAATITTLRSTTANATTGYIVTGVTTNFTSTNATATNLTGTAATITNITSTNGSITNITGTAATITTLRSNTSVTTGTLNAVTGVVTTISGSNASYTNINATHINATGIITATSFFGNGSGITSITASPGGSNKQIQFNNGGVTGGTPQLFYDFSNNRIGLGSDVPATSLDLYGNATTEALYVRNTSRPQGYVLSGVSASNYGRLAYYDGSVYGKLYINEGGGNVAISTNILTGTVSQAFQVNSGGYFNGKVGIANTNPAGGLEISTAGSTTVAQLTLSGTTNNWINLSATGSAAPSFTTRSAGTKFVLYNTLSGSAADIALGTDSATLWNSVQNTSSSFKWYGGTTLAGTLTGAGAFTAVAAIQGTTLTSTVATGTAPLTVSSTTQVSNLNASLLEGYATATAATGNTVVRRDASGNFSAGTITGNLSTSVLTNYTDAINALGNVTGTTNINLASGNFITATVTGTTSFTFTTGVATGAASFTLLLTNDAVAGRTVSWPAGVKWPAGSAPSRTTTANAVDLWTFFTPNNGTTWYGTIAIYDLK
jgi:hypothetical protein